MQCTRSTGLDMYRPLFTATRDRVRRVAAPPSLLPDGRQPSLPLLEQRRRVYEAVPEDGKRALAVTTVS